VVYGLLKTSLGVSPTVPAGTVWTSLILFTTLYGVLAAINIGLMVRTARGGPAEPTPADEVEPAFAY